jgi:hypothetical protein
MLCMNSKMSFKNNNNNIKSPTLQGFIVEHILLLCINGASICDLLFELQRILPYPYKAIKKYLFYLINYELLSYDGQRKAYVTEEGGFDLLDVINKEKKMAKVNSVDIVITIE